MSVGSSVTISMESSSGIRSSCRDVDEVAVDKLH